MLSDFVRSKLASLFGMDRAAQHGGNESLTYTAPKEPKKSKFLLLLSAYRLIYVDLYYVTVFWHEIFHFMAL